MKKAKTALLLTGMGLCLAVFAVCWLLSVRWYLIPAAAAAMLVCLFRTLLRRNEFRLRDKHFTLIFAGCCLFMLAAEIFFAFTSGYEPVLGDPVVYGAAAQRLADTGSFEGISEIQRIYASRYPNTWGMTFLTAGWYFLWHRVFGCIDAAAGYALDIIAIQITVVFTYLAARRIFPTRTDALICGISSAFCPVYLLYAPVFHSDIISTAFSAPAIYLIARGMKSSEKRRYGCFAGAALLTGIGNTIKGTMVLMAIAASIILLLRFKPKLSLPAAAMMTGCVVLASTGVMQLGLATGLSSRELLNEYRYPVVHWIMMGANSRGGGYHASDSRYTREAGDFEQKKQADIKKLRYRIKKMDGPAGIMVRAKLKVYYVWNCGDRRYSRYLSDTSPENDVTYFIINSEFTAAVCWITHACQMLCILPAMVYALRRHADPALKFAGMTLTGLIMFLVIWESAPRYTITYLPAMHLLSAAGVKYLCDVSRINCKKLREHLQKQRAAAI